MLHLGELDKGADNQRLKYDLLEYTVKEFFCQIN